MTAVLFHKNLDEVGPGVAPSGTPALLTKAGVVTGTVQGVKELVRFQFNVSATGADDYFAFRMLMPVWFDSV
jgi:hypothetical protein